MLTRRVDLRFPIELPGATITSVQVRPVTEASRALARASEEGKVAAVAQCIGLPAAVVMEMTDCDHGRVVEAIADMAFEHAEQALKGRRATLAMLPGGRA